MKFRVIKGANGKAKTAGYDGRPLEAGETEEFFDGPQQNLIDEAMAEARKRDTPRENLLALDPDNPGANGLKHVIEYLQARA